MSDTKLDLDLDPKKVIKSLNDIADETKKLSGTIDDSLGKDAVKSIDRFEKTAEQGTTKIQAFFRNLSKTVKEDLKTAFDFGKVMTGLKFGQNLSEGLKQVLDMEKAFARLNTRLQLSGDQLQSFKKNIGSAVSSTGQKLEDILPGVEVASSKGNIKDPKQLQAIAGMLSKTRSITGEDVSNVAEEAIDILKSQGSQITSSTLGKTIDAMQAARVGGAFKSAGEAGAAMRDISPYARQLGIDTRGAAGLTAVASKAGDAGQNILKQILDKGTTVGGQQQLNAVLGRNIFKNGKLNASELGKIDTNRFGNQAIMSQASGLTGANGQELKLFVDAFKDSMPQFNAVVKGANETAAQFDLATDNFGSSIDKFKEGLINSVRTVGDSLSHLGHDILGGHITKLGKDLKQVGQDVWDNKGSLAGGAALTVGVAAIAGGGLKNLLGIGKGVAEGKALEKSMGVTPVFVVNAAEISGGGPGGLTEKALTAGGGGAGGGVLASGAASIGSAITATVAAAASTVGLAAIGAYTALKSDKIGEGSDEVPKNAEFFNADMMKKAVSDGTAEGHEKTKSKSKEKINYTNPSAYPSTGAKI